MRKFHRIKRVEQWRSYIEYEIQARGLRCKIAPETVLSLIHVESNGNPYARKNETSQFYGPLQIGKAVTEDTRNHRDSSIFHGQGSDSINAFFDWAEKYDDRHQWEPDWIAIGWKAGVGTLRNYLKRKVQKGHSEAKLTAYLKRKWGTDKYLRWFDAAEEVWNG